MEAWEEKHIISEPTAANRTISHRVNPESLWSRKAPFPLVAGLQTGTQRFVKESSRGPRPRETYDSGRFSVFTGTFQDISAGRGHYKGKKAEVVPC